MNDPWNTVKIAIGKYAATFAPQQGLIGLGSGTTAHAFIEALAERFRRENLHITCLPTSSETAALAKAQGLPLIDENAWKGSLDVTFDGADLLRHDGSAIKGAGGALLREKIVATASKKVIFLVDERKWGEKTNPLLPITIIPFGAQATLREIANLGYSSTIRQNKGKPFLSDDGHWIVDIELDLTVGSWQELDKNLKAIPGVVETGIFYKMASEAVIGFSNGEIVHQRFESTP
jgi:ribose 5-phosphate isomerase A